MISLGGYNCPISILGAKDEWKYAQKREIKKISEIINKIIPIFMPLNT